MFLEFIKFLFYSSLIVIVSKYILVKNLRNLAENLDLKAETIGEVAGFATSMPEFLTIVTSSLAGLMDTSIFNVISSNIINLSLYILAIIFNKNIKKLKNIAIRADVILVFITIIIPILLIKYNFKTDIFIIPIFIILYCLFKFINKRAHKLYLRKQDRQLENEIEKEAKWERNNKKKTKKHIIILVLTGFILYFLGNRLGVILENLCNIFKIQEFYIGILLGLITSIPEMITFFESQKHYKSSIDKTLGVVEATNNLLESNILNLFIIQSIGIFIFAIKGL